MVKICKMRESAKIPTLGSTAAAGYDLYASLDCPVVIRPGENKLIPTGISLTPPDGYFEAVFPRSGIAVKRGLRLANCVAVIDQDYSGEVFVPLYNDSDIEQVVYNDDRIAQMVFLPYQHFDFEEVTSLEDTERGSGGFGSTGR